MIRLIRRGEGRQLRAIRLRALADIPEAFGQTLEQASAISEDEYEMRACAEAEGDERVSLIAESVQDGWVGMVAGRNEGDRIELISMWVAPTHRRRGIGQALIVALLAWARSKPAREVYLFVGERNAPAKALYSSVGFVPSGRSEPLAWNSAINEIEMICSLPVDAE